MAGLNKRSYITAGNGPRKQLLESESLHENTTLENKALGYHETNGAVTIYSNGGPVSLNSAGRTISGVSTIQHENKYQKLALT